MPAFLLLHPNNSNFTGLTELIELTMKGSRECNK